MSRQPFKNTGTRASELLQLIHSDLCGPMETSSIGGARYYVTFIDDYSRKVSVYFMKSKSETLEKFKEFKNLVENETNKKIKTLRKDNGKEYVNNDFKLFLCKSGIQHQTSNPYTPQQNGMAERMNRTLVERARCLILNSRLQKIFWTEGVSIAAYITNRSPTKALDYKTPYELWIGKRPNLNNMKIFGCHAMVHVPKESRRKWDSKATKMILVGYCEYTKGYRLYDESKKQIKKSRDVVFLEYTARNNCVIMPLTSLQEQETTAKQESDTDTLVNESSEEEQLYDTSSDMSYSERDDDPDYTPERHDDDSIPLRNITLRPRNIKPKPTTYFCYEEKPTCSSALLKEPETVEDTLSSPKAKEWKEAMDSEYESLLQNNTWTLVTLPEDKRIIPCKWVYKMKIDANGEVVRYKARLVIKGFRQRKGTEYNEMFVSVVRHTSIRHLFALAVKENLYIDQMDSVTAFLQGDIDSEIYMNQPPGYEHGQEVCRLNKSIYGL